MIWWGLAVSTKLAGGIWFVVGLGVVIVHTRWFREPMTLADPGSYQ
jgi:hypothetical protein